MIAYFSPSVGSLQKIYRKMRSSIRNPRAFSFRLGEGSSDRNEATSCCDSQRFSPRNCHPQSQSFTSKRRQFDSSRLFSCEQFWDAQNMKVPSCPFWLIFISNSWTILRGKLPQKSLASSLPKWGHLLCRSKAAPTILQGFMLTHKEEETKSGNTSNRRFCSKPSNMNRFVLMQSKDAFGVNACFVVQGICFGFPYITQFLKAFQPQLCTCLRCSLSHPTIRHTATYICMSPTRSHRKFCFCFCWQEVSRLFADFCYVHHKQNHWRAIFGSLPLYYAKGRTEHLAFVWAQAKMRIHTKLSSPEGLHVPTASRNLPQPPALVHRCQKNFPLSTLASWSTDVRKTFPPFYTGKLEYANHKWSQLCQTSWEEETELHISALSGKKQIKMNPIHDSPCMSTLNSLKVKVSPMFQVWNNCRFLLQITDREDVVPLPLHLYSLLLAHLNSSVNSIIYGLTNRQFRFVWYTEYKKEKIIVNGSEPDRILNVHGIMEKLKKPGRQTWTEREM